MNLSLLEDKCFRESVSAALRQLGNPDVPLSLCDQWYEAKREIAAFARRRHTEIHRDRTKRSRYLNRRWHTIADSPPPATTGHEYQAWVAEKESIETSLRGLYTDTSNKFASIRRARWIEEGERPTRYFFRQAKAARTFTHIESVQHSDGSLTTSLADTLDTTRGFYESLYARGETDRTAQLTLLAGVTARLSEAHLTDLNKTLDKKDVEQAIGQLGRWKAAGPDGFPAEFYKAFESELAPFLTAMFRECEENDTLPRSFGEARVILLYKKGDRTSLENWRPISLMNVDEKILTKILTTRLQVGLTSIISPMQSGFVQGRSIYDNIWALEHILEAGTDRGDAGAVVFLDQQKAYDRVDHQYLLACLDIFGIRGPWQRWVARIYRSLNTSITVNGFVTTPFQVRQGLRQGDPLSPLLYNIVVEPLLQRFQRSITGLSYGSFTIRAMAYADDIMVTLADERDGRSLQAALALHQAACNARVNAHKSLALFLPQSHFHLPYRIVPWNEPFRYLGAWYKDGKIAANLHQERLVSQLEQCVEAWRDRAVSVCGRVLLLNTFALSRIWFACHIFHLSSRTISRITHICRTFIWRGGRPHVDLAHLCLPSKLGGLGLLPLVPQSQSLLAKWFARVYRPNAPPWCSLARNLLESHLAKANLPPHALLTRKFTRRNCRRLPDEWSGRLLAWAAVGGGLTPEVETLSLQTVLALPLEAAITTRTGKPLTTSKPSYVNDLMVWSSALGRFVRRDDTSPYHTRILNRLMHRDLKLTSAVSKRISGARGNVSFKPWQESMRDLATMGGTNVEEYKAAVARKTFQAREGMAQSRLTPNADAKQTWSRVFSSALMPKHRSFMWMLHYKAVPHGSMIKHYTEDNGCCHLCGATDEKLEHAYFTCPLIRSFWDSVEITLAGPGSNSRIDFESAVRLTFKPRHGLALSTRLVPLTCAFWAIYRTRIKRRNENKQQSYAQLYSMWRQTVVDILLAKRRTAIKNKTYKFFVQKWGWLAKAVRLSLDHQHQIRL
jgi:hypothetical protein